MIFDSAQFASLQETCDITFSSPQQLSGSGLWVGLLSRGRCTLADDPTHLADPGSLLMGPGPLRLIAAEECHLLAVRIGGSAAATFLTGLESAFFADGASTPGAAGLLAQLVANGGLPAQQNGLCFQLLCELSGADAASPALPPLVGAAISSMRENYAGLYGVEELSDSLGVSKSHLVRVFKAAVGTSPGQYLTGVRIEAAKQLLCHREYPLEVVASLCGFSGANYLCRVFKKTTGITPAVWRSTAVSTTPTGPLPLEQELYI